MTTELWIGMCVLVLAALFIVWWPFRNRKKLVSKSHDARTQANIHSYRISLEKLDSQLNETRITPEAYDELKAELDLKLLQDESGNEQALQLKDHPVLVPIVLSGVLAIASILLYLSIGSSQELTASKARQTAIQAQQQKFQQALTILEQKVQQNPNNSQMLFNLAHFYLSAQQFDNAIAAFQQLIELEGEHAEFIGPQAQALYYKNNQVMTPKIQALTEQALALDPDDVSSLVLLGMDSFAQNDYANAIILWQQVINNGRPGTDIKSLTRAVEQAKERLLMTGQSLPDIPQPTLSTKGVSVTVQISDALRNEYTSDQIIFIYAIAVQGSRMPLAAAKLTAAQFPLTIRLDDSRAMTPNAKISQHETVKLFAVISQNGTPGIQSGDLHGMIESASLDATSPYTLIIDKIAE